MQTSLRTLTSYHDFAADLVSDGILTDPWVDGEPRFRMTPIAIDRRTQQDLYAAAECVAAVHAEAASWCAADPALVAQFFDLPPSYEFMWRTSAPRWHGIARADVFLTAAGPQVCELNSDTPSGEPEAVTLNRMVDGAGAAAFEDPNCRLADAVFAMVRALAAPQRPLTIGIVYPTEMTEDLSVIALYARWFRERGVRVVLGSPFNLRPDGRGGVALFGVSCAVIWRHYKTDWWGERRPIWRSEPPYADAEPLMSHLELLAGASARGQCAVINPFGAVLTQNKRTMALLWEHLDSLSAAGRRIVRRYLPYTARLESLPVRRLLEERAHWVLKSDYGCEGEEVIIGADTSVRAWADVLADALPRRWVAQRRFQPLLDRKKRAVNYGVYLVGGQAAGLFCRVQSGGTDRRAICAPALVRAS
ncbi:MAG TPA: glutathionylspermidine synthase family protein [Polyangia bacterium]|nr:glutathionylspermidine synthase family protein [Polyangia bacterium]